VRGGLLRVGLGVGSRGIAEERTGRAGERGEAVGAFHLDLELPLELRFESLLELAF
jgi:hypothetical protein